MPFCPNCTTEYAAGIQQCVDCGAALIASPPEGWQATGSPEAMRPVELLAADNIVELDLVEAQLRAAGIPTARRPRRVALFVSTANYETAKNIMHGRALGARPETLGLSELHRIRLVCESCEQATDIDLLTEHIPDRCECGRYFDLSDAREVLSRYTEVMQMMDEADFEIELVVPDFSSE
jgi:hypothetical protein